MFGVLNARHVILFYMESTWERTVNPTVKKITKHCLVLSVRIAFDLSQEKFYKRVIITIFIQHVQDVRNVVSRLVMEKKCFFKELQYGIQDVDRAQKNLE